MTNPTLIEQAITEHWGNRCPETEPGCQCCDAWAEYDALTASRAALEAALPSGVRVKPTIEEIARIIDPTAWSDLYINGYKTKREKSLEKAARILSAIEPAQAPSHAETVAPYAAALRMIRDAVGELFGPVSDLESEEAVLLRGPEPHHEVEAIIAGLQRVKVQNGRLEKSLQEAHEISERYREMYATKSNEKVEEFRRASTSEAILRSIATRPELMNALDTETAGAIHSALHPEREG